MFFIIACLLFAGTVHPSPSAASRDEFTGPFANWANLKTDFGAAGDGITDDTDALQRALDSLRPADRARNVLWIPAGTYRITRTLIEVRTEHHHFTGIGIFGAHPDSVSILWDGADSGVMMRNNSWYARMGRITFDGNGRAKTGILHSEPFASMLEYQDMVFKGLAFGIAAGGSFSGIAEAYVKRCRFLACGQAGISIEDWNTLDWWIESCLFEGCARAVTNVFGAGHFHLYECVFRASSIADLEIGNTMYFAFRNNFSSGSRRFITSGNTGNPAEITLQGNTILDATDTDCAVYIGNTGPVFLLDNVIRPAPGAAVVGGQDFTDGDYISMGNTFTTADAFSITGRLTRIGDRIVEPGFITAVEPALPPVLLRSAGPVFEISAGSASAAIQTAIDQAAALNGQRPIIHLQNGSFNVDQTLVIPAGCDLQLVGDGVLNSTSLNWQGAGTGPVLRLQGPSRATLREFLIYGGDRADGIVAENCDQSGGRVVLHKVMVSDGVEDGLFIEGVERTRVLMSQFLHNDSHIGVRVTAGPNRRAGLAMPENLALLNGASSGNDFSYEVMDGAHLLVRETWYETPFNGTLSRFMRLGGPSVLTFQSSLVALPAVAGEPAITLEDFSGKVTFANFLFIVGTDGDDPLKIDIDAASTGSLLIMGSSINHRGGLVQNNSSAARVSLQHCQYSINGTSSITNQGPGDSAFILEMMSQARTGVIPPPVPVPTGLTDLRIDGVTSRNCRRCIHLQADPAATAVRLAPATAKTSLEVAPGFFTLTIPWTGPHTLRVAGLNGKVCFEKQLMGPGKYRLDGEMLPDGVSMVTVTGRHHSFSRSLVLLR